MSNQHWQPPSRGPATPGIGMVPGARERNPASPSLGVPTLPRMIPANPQQASRLRPPMPIALSSGRGGPLPVGVAISRPTPATTQWPLAGAVEPGQQYHPPPGRGPAPPRPPRPSQVPIAFDISQLEVESPTSEYGVDRESHMERSYNRREEEDGMGSAVTSPLTQSSQSSAGSIPDFPIPVLPPTPRRSANLGPPPTSRRGASSYYSQASFVSPIPEESPRTATHLSYASSAAMPTSWESSSPRYDTDEDDYGDEDVYERRDFDHSPTIDEGRESRGSGDDRENRDDETGLIRSASFGRRAKPSMITTRSSDRIDARSVPMPQQMPTPTPNHENVSPPLSVDEKEMGVEQRQTGWPTVSASPSPPPAEGAGRTDRSEQKFHPVDASPAYAYADPAMTATLGAYNSASTLHPPSPIPTRTPSPGNGFSRLSAVRRPPKLNLDAVRDAEARGSLTSLPDLIARATRLAAMIDRGKRPGSRMALNDFPSDSEFKEMNLSENTKRKSGFMISAFPTSNSRTGTPDGRSAPNWPAGYGPSPLSQGQGASDPNNPKPQRRCCGLPRWGFILELLILLTVTAAGVLVPLKLLVWDKSDDPPSASAVSAASCAVSAQTSCQNGGTSTVENNACACLCANGFSGSTCTASNATSCDTASNVTMGDRISRLIAGSSNFSIPLNQDKIVARFNAANMSCGAENALVTFAGSAGGSLVNEKRQADEPTPSPTPTAQGAAATMHSIIYDASTPAPNPDFKPSDSSAPAAPTSATDTVDPSANFAVTDSVLDFSRVAVLYILQQESLDNAITAQGALQGFFKLQSYTNRAARNVSLGGGNVVDLVGGWVDLGDGAIGGTGLESGSASSRRDLAEELIGAMAL